MLNETVSATFLPTEHKGPTFDISTAAKGDSSRSVTNTVLGCHYSLAGWWLALVTIPVPVHN